MRVRVRVLFLAMVLAVLWAVPAGAAAKKGADDEFITYYYRSPDPKKVPGGFDRLDSLSSPMSSNSGWGLGSFLAEVFAKHPELADQMVAARDRHSGEWRYTVAIAVTHARVPGKNEYVDKLLPGANLAQVRKELQEGKPVPLAKIPVTDPGILDALWGGFFASGKVTYVRRIISTLGYSMEKGKKAVTAVQIAAEWSLAANAARHPLVLETCKKAAQVKSMPEDRREVLLAVISKAEKEPGGAQYSLSGPGEKRKK